MLPVLAILVLYLSAINCISHDLPDYFPRCSIDDPNLNHCLLRAFNTARPYVKKGVKEIGILPFEPLILSTFTISQEADMVNYTFTAWNFTVKGIENYNVKEINYDPKTLVFTTAMEFDPLEISSIYKVSGRILHIALEGKGRVEATLGPINATIAIKGELIDIEGTKYYYATNIKVTLNIKDGNFTFNGLFGGDELLGRAANEAFNRFSAPAIEACTPALEQFTEEMFMRFMRQFTGTIPYHNIFPKIVHNLNKKPSLLS